MHGVHARKKRKKLRKRRKKLGKRRKKLRKKEKKTWINVEAILENAEEIYE